MGNPDRNRIVAFACVVCSVGRDAVELLVWWNLVEQVSQHGSVPDAAARDLDCRYLQRFLIDPNMYLAPQPPFRPTRCPAGYWAAIPERGLAAFHSPSPSVLIPVLSTNRCRAFVEPLYRIVTDNVF
jgi:hypothetical protein